MAKRYSVVDETEYPKLRAFHKLENLGLPVHDYRLCKTLGDLFSAVVEFDYCCSIRTDCKMETGSEKIGDYPFYKVHTVEEFLGNLECYISNIKAGYVFIVANGLKYDIDLVYNMVFKVAQSGEFICEFSRLKVPLKHMYRFTDKLNTVTGNLTDGMGDWQRQIKDPGLDLRVIRDYLLKMWDRPEIQGKYVEMTLYKEQKEVYWEIY